MLRKPRTATTVPHQYSVRLAGLSLWEQHLKSMKAARRSAEEPREMGLQDVHIFDEETGRCIE
jgi:hypothetical protein